jgi:hypothetical protein
VQRVILGVGPDVSIHAPVKEGDVALPWNNRGERGDTVGQSPRTAELSLDRSPQGRQCTLQRVPHELRRDVFVIVAIHISCCRHLFPADGRVAGLQIIRQAARRFGNDLQASRAA